MATAATMGAIDALNQFGRSPQKLAVKQEFEDLEEDEEFMLGPMSSSQTGPPPVQPNIGSASAQAGPSVANGEEETMDLEEDESFMRDDTPPYTGRDNGDGNINDNDDDREETPPYPGRDSQTPPYRGRDEKATPPYTRPAATTSSPTSRQPPVNIIQAGNDDNDLEEDPAFMLLHPSEHASTSRQVSPLGVARRSDKSATNEVLDDLEEDPSFMFGSAAAGPSSIPPSSPPRFTSPPISDHDTRGDSPHVTTADAYRNLTRPSGADTFDVSRVNLGRHVSRVRDVKGISYNGQSIRFKRQKGHAVVGELSIASTSALSSSTANGRDPSELGKLALSLLEKPIHVLMENIEHEKAKAEALRREQTIHDNLVEVYGEQRKPKVKSAGSKGKAGETWTDRYKPKLFTELLGDERTHRQAMSWLKEWDSCVFKTRSAAVTARKKQLKRARTEAANTYGFEGEKEYQDPLGRPKDKILLLTGPPGLGKTTLAHVIASQAGYRVSEINASDDRSAKVVRDRIRQSVESTTITSLGALSSSKPTCLIIDEIDGAAGGDAGFIKALVKLVMDGSRIPNAKYASAAGNKKKKDMPPLQRPIICICNDLYIPALRPLRAIARIVRFQPPTNAMLVRRLKDICEREHLKADHKALTMLVEVAEGDMRSCLNTLQIVKAQNAPLDVSVIKSTALGLKDTQTSVTAVWDKLFKTPAKIRKKGIDEHISGKYITSLVKDITTCGEYDKLAQTCFENYLKGKTPADEMRAVSRALDWLQSYDQFSKRLYTERDYDILPYIPFTFVAWNPLFAAVANKTPEWPRIDYEMFLKRSAHQEVADGIAKALPMHIKSLFTGANVVAELAPLLMRIVTPDLRPVNQQLVKSEDRVVLKKLVRAMLDLGISYVQDRNEDGQIIYKLDPPLDIFTSYNGSRAGDLPTARFNLRQLVSKELEAETLRRAGSGVDGTDATRNIGDIMQSYKSTKGPQAADPKATGTAVDFFGRPILVKHLIIDGELADQDPHQVQPPKKRVKVFYKYHEGFSNAVRSNVKVTDLFR